MEVTNVGSDDGEKVGEVEVTNVESDDGEKVGEVEVTNFGSYASWSNSASWSYQTLEKSFVDTGIYLNNSVSSNPTLVKGGIVTAAVIGGFVACPTLLGVVGFTSVGPAAGSLAASWMSSIGVVQAGSLYSIVQSAAMGGAAATTLNGVAATVAGVGAYFGVVGASAERNS